MILVITAYINKLLIKDIFSTIVNHWANSASNSCLKWASLAFGPWWSLESLLASADFSPESLQLTPLTLPNHRKLKIRHGSESHRNISYYGTAVKSFCKKKLKIFFPRHQVALESWKYNDSTQNRKLLKSPLTVCFHSNTQTLGFLDLNLRNPGNEPFLRKSKWYAMRIEILGLRTSLRLDKNDYKI